MADAERPDPIIELNPSPFATLSERDRKRTEREKFEEQKKALQRLLILTIDRGCASGLTAAEATAVKAAFVVLGWLPTDLKV